MLILNSLKQMFKVVIKVELATCERKQLKLFVAQHSYRHIQTWTSVDMTERRLLQGRQKNYYKKGAKKGSI